MVTDAQGNKHATRGANGHDHGHYLRCLTWLMMVGPSRGGSLPLASLVALALVEYSFEKENELGMYELMAPYMYRCRGCRGQFTR